MSELPIWDEIAGHATDALDAARKGLSDARDWMNSDWAEGHGPASHEARHEAARAIAEAKQKIDAAKRAIAKSAGW